MAVFLHIYSPDNDFLYAALNFFFKKLAENHYTEKQNEYVRYVFKKIIRRYDVHLNISWSKIASDLIVVRNRSHQFIIRSIRIVINIPNMT